MIFHRRFFNEKYHFHFQYYAPSRVAKLKYWFFFTAKSDDSVMKHYTLVLFGCFFQFSRKYKKKFSYKKMPKIKGRRKQK